MKMGSLLAVSMASMICLGAGNVSAAQWVSAVYVNDWTKANDFVNGSCKPSDLSGVHFLIMQLGHGAPYKMYVWCRKDGSSEHYKFTGFVFNNETALMGAMDGIAANPNVKVGTVYYGASGEGGEVIYLIHE